MKKKSFSYAKYGYLFTLPFTIAYLIFSAYPTLYTAIIGFTDLKGIGKTDWHFLKEPFANFVTILTSPTFQNAFKNTVFLWVCNFIPQLLLALLLAGCAATPPAPPPPMRFIITYQSTIAPPISST